MRSAPNLCLGRSPELWFSGVNRGPDEAIHALVARCQNGVGCRVKVTWWPFPSDSSLHCLYFALLCQLLSLFSVLLCSLCVSEGCGKQPNSMLLESGVPAVLVFLTCAAALHECDASLPLMARLDEGLHAGHTTTTTTTT